MMDTRKKKIKPWLRSTKEKIHVPNADSDSDSGPTSKTLREYGSATSVHGIPYILEDGRKPVERLLWIIFVGIGAGTATYFSFNIYQDWQNQQVITSVGTTGYNIENIQFPSITICAQGSIKKVTGIIEVSQFEKHLFQHLFLYLLIIYERQAKIFLSHPIN